MFSYIALIIFQVHSAQLYFEAIIRCPILPCILTGAMHITRLSTFLQNSSTATLLLLLFTFLPLENYLQVLTDCIFAYWTVWVYRGHCQTGQTMYCCMRFGLRAQFFLLVLKGESRIGDMERRMLAERLVPEGSLQYFACLFTHDEGHSISVVRCSYCQTPLQVGWIYTGWL